ncbi:MAG: hypothetical protein WBD34_20840 [Burkholderiaceae bacterium]
MARTNWLLAGTVPQWMLYALSVGAGGYTLVSSAAYVFVFFFPLAWAWSTNRWTAAWCALLYYAAASALVPSSIIDYAPFGYTHPAWGVVGWLLLSVCCAVPWLLLYRRDDQYLLLRLFAVALLCLLPPFGFIQPAWPFLGIGIIAPATGLLGLIAGIWFLSHAARRPLLLLLPFAVVAWNPPTAIAKLKALSPQWVAHGTTVPMATTTLDFAKSYLALLDFRDHALGHPETTFVLPESIAGLDLVATGHALTGLDTQVIFAGGLNPESDGALRAVFFEYSPPFPTGRIVYTQRVPVPLLAGESIRPLTNAVVPHGSDRLGFLLCYEGFTGWAPFSSAVAGATVFVVGANLAFSRYDGALHRAYLSHLEAWGRLFGVPLVVAVNRRPPDV